VCAEGKKNRKKKKKSSFDGKPTVGNVERNNVSLEGRRRE